jgi:hypothetical protein
MIISTIPRKLSLVVLRNGVVGGVLLVLSRALDPVLYYLNAYLILLLMVGLLAFTAYPLQKHHPQLNLRRLVVLCWGVYALAVIIHACYAKVTNRLLQESHLRENVTALLILLLFGAVLSVLVVLGVRLGKPIPKQGPQECK